MTRFTNSLACYSFRLLRIEPKKIDHPLTKSKNMKADALISLVELFLYNCTVLMVDYLILLICT